MSPTDEMRCRWLVRFDLLCDGKTHQTAGRAVRKEIVNELRGIKCDERSIATELHAHGRRMRNRYAAADGRHARYQREWVEKNRERANEYNRNWVRRNRALYGRKTRATPEAQEKRDKRKQASAEKRQAITDRKAAAKTQAKARLRAYENSWPRKAKRKLGRNAHRMPEIVALYKLTCELKRARQ